MEKRNNQIQHTVFGKAPLVSTAEEPRRPNELLLHRTVFLRISFQFRCRRVGGGVWWRVGANALRGKLKIFIWLIIWTCRKAAGGANFSHGFVSNIFNLDLFMFITTQARWHISQIHGIHFTRPFFTTAGASWWLLASDRCEGRHQTLVTAPLRAAMLSSVEQNSSSSSCVFCCVFSKGSLTKPACQIPRLSKNASDGYQTWNPSGGDAAQEAKQEVKKKSRSSVCNFRQIVSPAKLVLVFFSSSK